MFTFLFFSSFWFLEPYLLPHPLLYFGFDKTTTRHSSRGTNLAALQRAILEFSTRLKNNSVEAMSREERRNLHLTTDTIPVSPANTQGAVPAPQEQGVITPNDKGLSSPDSHRPPARTKSSTASSSTEKRKDKGKGRATEDGSQGSSSIQLTKLGS
jgi:hypothetical protein